MVELPDGEKNCGGTCNRLDTIPACDRRTDRQTNRQTNILPRHSPRYAYASRGKNCNSSCSKCNKPWSNLCVPVTRRATAFSTHCSLSVTYLGDPAKTALQ